MNASHIPALQSTVRQASIAQLEGEDDEDGEWTHEDDGEDERGKWGRDTTGCLIFSVPGYSDRR